MCVWHVVCISSLHFSGAVVWLRETVALFEKAQDIMIGDGLVRKITYKRNALLLSAHNFSQFQLSNT